MRSEFRHVCYRINILGSQLSPSSINLVPEQAGKKTVGLASHWLRVTDISSSPPTGSRPRRGRRAPAYALIVEHGELYPFYTGTLMYCAIHCCCWQYFFLFRFPCNSNDFEPCWRGWSMAINSTDID